MKNVFIRVFLVLTSLFFNFNLLFAQVKTFNIGFFSLFMAAPFIYAEQTGLFNKEGLNVKIIPYASLTEMLEDFHNEKLDAAIFPIPMVFSYKLGLLSEVPSENIKVVLVAGANGGSLVVIDSSIKNPKELKGKTVVSFSKMCPCYPLLRYFLIKYGIDPEKDTRHIVFNFDELIDYILERNRLEKELHRYKNFLDNAKDERELKELRTKYESLRARYNSLPKISAFLIPEPNTAFVKSLTGGYVMARTRNIWRDHPFGGLVVKEKILIERKETLAKIIGIIGKISLDVDLPQNRENLVRVLLKTRYNPPEFTYSILKEALKPGETDYTVFPYKSSAVAWVEILKTLGMLPAKVDSFKLAEETFASEFTREALKKAGVPVPPLDYRPEVIMGEIKKYKK